MSHMLVYINCKTGDESMEKWGSNIFSRNFYSKFKEKWLRNLMSGEQGEKLFDMWL